MIPLNGRYIAPDCVSLVCTYILQDSRQRALCCRISTKWRDAIKDGKSFIWKKLAEDIFSSFSWNPVPAQFASWREVCQIDPHCYRGNLKITRIRHPGAQPENLKAAIDYSKKIKHLPRMYSEKQLKDESFSPLVDEISFNYNRAGYGNNARVVNTSDNTVFIRNKNGELLKEIQIKGYGSCYHCIGSSFFVMYLNQERNQLILEELNKEGETLNTHEFRELSFFGKVRDLSANILTGSIKVDCFAFGNDKLVWGVFKKDDFVLCAYDTKRKLNTFFSLPLNFIGKSLASIYLSSLAADDKRVAYLFHNGKGHNLFIWDYQDKPKLAISDSIPDIQQDHVKKVIIDKNNLFAIFPSYLFIYDIVNKQGKMHKISGIINSMIYSNPNTLTILTGWGWYPFDECIIEFPLLNDNNPSKSMKTRGSDIRTINQNNRAVRLKRDRTARKVFIAATILITLIVVARKRQLV